MAMYTDFYHQGKSLPEWASVFKNEFSLGELYMMASEGTDFNRLYLERNGEVSEN